MSNNDLTVLDGNGAVTAPTVNNGYETLNAKVLAHLVEEAKKMKTAKKGMISPDSIPYFEVDEQLSKGDEIRFTYAGRFVDERIEPETGEVKYLPTVVLIDQEGQYWKNSTHMLITHFASKQSGYKANVHYKGIKKTSKGNKMQSFEIHQLIDA